MQRKELSPAANPKEGPCIGSHKGHRWAIQAGNHLGLGCIGPCGKMRYYYLGQCPAKIPFWVVFLAD